ncbi:MAG: hypothetical protein ACK5JT_19460, partial [Hyphomicrobiaceae bacterium]
CGMLTVTEHIFKRQLTPAEESEFYTWLRLPNGVFKTTADQRMADLNAMVIEHWRQDSFAPQSIMDVGVSSGITTAEFFDDMHAAGLDVDITATDLVLTADVVPLWPGSYSIARDGDALRHVIFGASLRSWPRRLDRVTGYALVRRLANTLAARHTPNRTGRVLLVSPRALRGDAITWTEDDLLASPNPGFAQRFDVVRAANILNIAYFSAPQLTTALRNLRQRLKGPGARLIVNRTLLDDTNHGTMFQLDQDGRFRAEARIGTGSEIEDLVLSLP